ncbi:MAG: DNA polymerase III subunit delta, partial [Cutibacterium acnes]
MQTSLAHWRGYRSCGILGQVNSVYGTALLVQGAEALLSDRAVDARIKATRREFPDAELV